MLSPKSLTSASLKKSSLCFAAALVCSALSAGRPGPLFSDALDAVYNPAQAQNDLYAEPVDVIVLDAIASPGRQTVLSAQVRSRNKRIFRAMENALVEFSVDGSTAGRAETKKSGVARITLAQDLIGRHLISAVLPETDLFKAATGFALFDVVSSTRPILLVDFDSALHKGIPGKFQFSGVESLRPLPHAAEALAALAENYTLIYLTDWDVSALPKIRRWIHHWKLPKAAVIFWSFDGKVLRDANWKSAQMAKLSKEWRNLRAGVGGTSDVLRAFRSARLNAFSIKSSLLREPGALSDWKEVKEEIERIK